MYLFILFCLNCLLLFVSGELYTLLHSCQHFKIPISNETDQDKLVFEAILHDSRLNTRQMLKLFSLPIARLHSGGHHDETVGALLVPVYYPLLHRTYWNSDKQGIDTTLIDIIILFGTFQKLLVRKYLVWVPILIFTIVFVICHFTQMLIKWYFIKGLFFCWAGKLEIRKF